MRISLEHVAGRVPVIVTISHFATGIVVERAKAARAMGAAMVMMMLPYHGVGLVPEEQGIVAHFRAVSDAISIPIMVQDAPLSGVSLPVPLLVRMAREIEYFKIETPFAADKPATLIEEGGRDITGPFDGAEAATLLADLDAGATGTMTSGLLPDKIPLSSSTTPPGGSIRRSINGGSACRLSITKTASVAFAPARLYLRRGA